MSIAPPGIAEKIYVGGQDLSINPAAVGFVPARAQAVERFLDMTANVDIPDVGDGLAPIVTTKFTFPLSWPRVKAEDDELLQAVLARGGFVDFCPWMMHTETFAGVSGELTYKLARRIALSVVDGAYHPLDTSHLATKVYNSDFGGTLMTLTTDYSFGSPDSSGRTPITFTAPAPDFFRVRYCPLFSTFVQDEQAAAALMNGKSQQITLEER